MVDHVDEHEHPEAREAQLREEPGKFIRVSGAPDKLARLKFEDMDRFGNEAAFVDLEEVAKQLAAEERTQVSLVLAGGFGTGKTRLAVWLLWHAYAGATWGRRHSELQFPRFFRSTALGALRFRAFGGAEDVAEEDEDDRQALHLCPLVVIDDICRLSDYKGEQLYLETVIEHRYDAGLSTVLTMNELPIEGRFSDFLKYFRQVLLRGRSHRKE